MTAGDQPNMQELLQQAQQMQEQLMAAQQELADTEVRGSAGGGLVTANVNGTGELLSVVIDPKAIDTGNAAETAENLADLFLAAVRDATRAAGELQEQKMGPLAQGLGGESGTGLPGA